MKPAWKDYLLYGSVIIVVGTAAFILIETIRLKNTGFEGKSLWDWMGLLIIPFVLAIGAFYLNRSERKNERQIATDRQQEAALQSYIDRMADLILKERLRVLDTEEVRNIARIRTLTVLRGLDGRRKGLVVRFLYEAGLIDKDKPIIALRGADLSGADLSGADLSKANLAEVNLAGANLSRAQLHEANFIEANLDKANLTETNLYTTNLWQANLNRAQLHGAILLEANLNEANLVGANLSEADLTRASLDAELRGTNLRGAVVSEEQLAEVKSLHGATMPDGKKHV